LSLFVPNIPIVNFYFTLIFFSSQDHHSVGSFDQDSRHSKSRSHKKKSSSKEKRSSSKKRNKKGHTGSSSTSISPEDYHPTMARSDAAKLKEERARKKMQDATLASCGLKIDQHGNLLMLDGTPVPVGPDNKPLVAVKNSANDSDDGSTTNGDDSTDGDPDYALPVANIAPSAANNAQKGRKSKAIIEMEEQLVHVKKKRRKGGNSPDMDRLIHDAVKNSSWRKIKFAHGQAQRESATRVVLSDLDMLEFKGEGPEKEARREQWVEAYTGTVVKKFNKQRSYAQTQVSKAVTKWMDSHKGQIPNTGRLEALLKREIDPKNDDDYALMKWYWTEVLPMAAGNSHDWAVDKRYYLTLTEGAPANAPDKKYVPPSTEAIAVAFIENNRDKWAEIWKLKQHADYVDVKFWRPNVKLEYETDKDGKKVLAYEHQLDDTGEAVILNSPIFWGKFTKLDAGQCSDSGWTVEGREKFTQWMQMNKAARARPECLEVEREFLKLLRAEKGIKAKTADEEGLRRRREKNKKDRANEAEEREVVIEFDE